MRPQRLTQRSLRTLLIAGAALTAATGLALLTIPRVQAQNRMAFSPESPDGHVTLGLALRKLSVSATFLQAPAHPDDETNALFALFGYGMGMRVIDLQNNRGDGGQNEIGPELFHDMAVLRTSELLSAHRVDGAEQYFTRAIDYGYSFDPNEVIEKWGRKDIVGDYVRLLRTLRPDVTLTMNIQGSGGDRAHEATTILFREAFRAAGDPAQYPEQLKEGLHPWQAKKLYFAGGRGAIPAGGAPFGGAPFGGAPGGGAPTGGRGRGGRGGNGAAAPAGPPLTPAATQTYDPLLGRTYSDIGNDARSYHKCQGLGALLPTIPGVPGRGFGGGRGGGYSLQDTTIPGELQKSQAKPGETSLFEGIDTSLTSIAQYAGDNPPAALTSALDGILRDAKQAQKAFADGDDAATAAPVLAGLVAVRALRAQLPSLGLNDAARYEVDFRLNLKERDYEDALLAAHNLTFDAIADDGLVVAGQPIRLSLVAMNRGGSDVDISGVTVAGFDAPAACATGTAKADAAYTCTSEAHIPQDAKPTTPYFHDNYWAHPETNQAIQIFDPSVPFGVPFAPSPFQVTFHVKFGNVEISRELPVEYRYVEDIYFGDKRMELNVVPAFSVHVDPGLAVIPAPTANLKPSAREIHVTVTNGTKGPAQAVVALEVPAGWKVSPASQPVAFEHEDESLSARFAVTAPANVKTGQYSFHAVVTSPSTGDEKFSTGYKAIEYPHVERRQVMEPAETTVKVVDVKITAGIKVGYIVGVGDQVPPALEQLGAKVSDIDQDELAFGDLSKYDVVITGVRAYERRADLRAYNRRLLDYVQRGGTVIVQYNKTEFNQAQYGPYPAKVTSNRITDETAPVKILVPSDQVFNYPNKLGPETWANWTQERGLYFLGDVDPKYTELIAMTDPFKDNPGEKLGSLVEAKYGKGRWFYLGLGLWRQLPAGTDGAYQILANLISPVRHVAAPKAKTPPTEKK